MNNYHFQYQNSYIGYWTLPHAEKHLTGILHVNDQVIKLELVHEPTEYCYEHSLDQIYGNVEAELNGKTIQYHVALWGLTLSHVSSTSCVCHIDYEVEHIMFYTGEPNTHEIKSFLIRTPLLDKWVRDINNLRCKDNQFDLLTTNCNQYKLCLDLTQHHSIYKSDTEEYIIDLLFGIDKKDARLEITTYSFLRWRSANTLSENEDIIFQRDKVIVLLSLLWNNRFAPEFVQFDTTGDNFIYKDSNKLTRHFNFDESSCVFSTYDDFSKEDFVKIIDGWNLLHKNYPYAMKLWHNIRLNTMMPYESRIKDLIDIIDGLTADINVPEQYQNHKWDELIDKVEKSNCLSKEEMSKLKGQLVSIPYLKRRMDQMLLIIKPTLSQTADFTEKSINTRNHLTHVNKVKGEMYEKDEYSQLSRVLEQVICTYMLYTMGLDEKLIKKIVGNTIKISK